MEPRNVRLHDVLEFILYWLTLAIIIGAVAAIVTT